MEHRHTKASMAQERDVSIRSIENYIALAEKQVGHVLGLLCKEDGKGKRKFSDAERDLILSFCQKPSTLSPHPSTPVLTVETSIVPITETVDADLPATVNLNNALAHIDGAKGLALTNTQAVVNQVENFLSQITNALEDKVDRQRQQVESDSKQLYRLRALRNNFQETAAELGTQSKRLARVQTATTEDLQALAQDLISLGQ
jgi:hypothetical protein